MYVTVTLGLLFSDEHRLSDYSIGPEAKLNLVVRPACERSGNSSSSPDKAGSGVWQLLSTVLAKHFSPADAAKVQEQLIKVPSGQKYVLLQKCFFFFFLITFCCHLNVKELK